MASIGKQYVPAAVVALTENVSLQMTSVSAGSLMTLGFGYSATQNNGNLLSQTIARTSPGFSATQNYSYTDGVNRLTAASEGSNWNQGYVYDHVGNRAVTGSSSIVVSNYTPQTSGTTVPFNASNQWSGAGNPAGYDGAGNMTTLQGTMTMTYDAESRMTAWAESGASVALAYDGVGRRVTKTSSVTGTTISVYDPAGNLAAEYGGQTPSVSGTLYLTQDHLGSTRLVTNASAGVVGCHDYLPFGEEIPAAWGSRPSCYGQTDTTVKFTGQERDAETAADGGGLTGFDNFWARMMAGSQGRFLSPDPDNAGADATNPQSWNMYGYVFNNPLAYVDPSGLNPCVNGVNPDTGNICATGTASLPSEGGSNPGGVSFYNPCNWFGGCLGPTFSTTVFWQPPKQLPLRVVGVVAQRLRVASQAACTTVLREGGTRAGFFANLPIYQGMAKSLKTNADFIMSVSSWESGWLGTHAQEIQNLFGLTRNGGNDINYVGRGGYQASADYWVKRVGPYVNGAGTMPKFLSGLKNEGYNKNPGYFATIGDQLQWVQKWEAICAQ